PLDLGGLPLGDGGHGRRRRLRAGRSALSARVPADVRSHDTDDPAAWAACVRLLSGLAHHRRAPHTRWCPCFGLPGDRRWRGELTMAFWSRTKAIDTITEHEAGHR